jgi:hypothetical protein
MLFLERDWFSVYMLRNSSTPLIAVAVGIVALAALYLSLNAVY